MLEQLVHDRTRDLDEARVEALSRLALAAEYRDDATGEHTQRVGRTSALIARDAGPARRAGLADPPRGAAARRGQDRLARQHPAEARHASPRRRSRRCRQHVTIGRSILSGSSSPLLKMAEEIAWTHHERWDGKGYLSGMTGDEIPLVGPDRGGRRRVRRAHPQASLQGRLADRARRVAQIVAESGTHFDPLVVDAFRCARQGGPPEPSAGSRGVLVRARRRTASSAAAR